MARAMCCDRCGEFFKFDDETYSDRKYKLLDHTKRGSCMLNGDWVDLCDKCYEKLEQFMDNKDFLYPDETLTNKED